MPHALMCGDGRVRMAASPAKRSASAAVPPPRAVTLTDVARSRLRSPPRAAAAARGRALTRAASATSREEVRVDTPVSAGRYRAEGRRWRFVPQPHPTPVGRRSRPTRQAARDQRRRDERDENRRLQADPPAVALDCRFPRLPPSHACHIFGSVLSVRGPCSITHSHLTQSRSSGSRHVRKDAWTRMHTVAHFSRTI